MNKTLSTTPAYPASKTTQAGITLIELMVALAVSSFILLGISNIYVATKKSYVVQDEFARIQENGRFAVELLSSSVRNAGFFGCASGQGLGTVINGLNNSNDAAWNFETGLMGYEANGTDIGDTKIINPDTQSDDNTDWTTAAGMTSGGNPISVNPDAAVATLAIEGSDILVIRTSKGTGIRVLKNNGAGNVWLQNTGSTGTCSNGDAKLSGLCENDILLVSDCSNSRIFQATNIQAVGAGACGGQNNCLNVEHSAGASPGNAQVTWNPPGNVFTEDAEVIKVVTKTFFVGVADSGGEPALYVRENDGTPVPVVESIENMQILYGIDTDTTPDGIANKYVSANDVTDLDGNSDTVFDAVVSVKISLLVRTANDIPGLKRNQTSGNDYSKLTYKMVTPVSPIIIDPIANDSTSTDRRMRKMYNMTIKIRNKSFNTAIES